MKAYIAFLIRAFIPKAFYEVYSDRILSEYEYIRSVNKKDAWLFGLQLTWGVFTIRRSLNNQPITIGYIANVCSTIVGSTVVVGLLGFIVLWSFGLSLAVVVQDNSDGALLPVEFTRSVQELGIVNSEFSVVNEISIAEYRQLVSMAPQILSILHQKLDIEVDESKGLESLIVAFESLELQNQEVSDNLLGEGLAANQLANYQEFFVNRISHHVLQDEKTIGACNYILSSDKHIALSEDLFMSLGGCGTKIQLAVPSELGGYEVFERMIADKTDGIGTVNFFTNEGHDPTVSLIVNETIFISSEIE